MEIKVFNVLVLGETQSGKSTLLEALKRYADPTYKINSAMIGSGNVSLTTQVRQEAINTQLPEYSVYKVDRSQRSEVQPKAQHRVHHDLFIKEDMDTYEEMLNVRREFQLSEPRNPWSPHMLTFNIIDTPGLNDTKDQDEDHVFKIISALRGQSIDLVLVTISRGAFTQGLQQALRSYMDLFPQLGDIMAFVHTRVDYLELHPGMTNFQSYMDEKMEALDAIMRRPSSLHSSSSPHSTSFPHFWIDCDFETTKPVRKCITNNTLRRILRLAVENKPVAMLHSKTLNKTPKMKEIDRIIKSQVQAVTQAIESTLEFNDQDEGVLLRGVYIRATKINELQARINILQDLQRSYQTDELGLLFEERFDDIRRPLDKARLRTTRYAGEHTIDDVVVWCENFRLCGLEGEPSSESWKGTFEKKRQGYNGYYHVKLYAKKCNRFKTEVDAIVKNIAELEEQRQSKLDESAEQSKEALSKIQSFIDAHNQHMEVIRLASADTLHQDLFFELVEARAFAGPTNESSEKVAAIYRDFVRRGFLYVNKPLPSPQAELAKIQPMHTTTSTHTNAISYAIAEGQMLTTTNQPLSQQQQTPQPQLQGQRLKDRDQAPSQQQKALPQQQQGPSQEQKAPPKQQKAPPEQQKAPPEQQQQTPSQQQQVLLQQQQTPLQQHQALLQQHQALLEQQRTILQQHQTLLQQQQTPLQQQQISLQQQQTSLQQQQISLQQQQTPLQQQQTPLPQQQIPKIQTQAISENPPPVPPRVRATDASTTAPVDPIVGKPQLGSSGERPAHGGDFGVDRSEDSQMGKDPCEE